MNRFSDPLSNKTYPGSNINFYLDNSSKFFFIDKIFKLYELDFYNLIDFRSTNFLHNSGQNCSGLSGLFENISNSERSAFSSQSKSVQFAHRRSCFLEIFFHFTGVNIYFNYISKIFSQYFPVSTANLRRK